MKLLLFTALFALSITETASAETTGQQARELPLMGPIETAQYMGRENISAKMHFSYTDGSIGIVETHTDTYTMHGMTCYSTEASITNSNQAFDFHESLHECKYDGNWMFAEDAIITLAVNNPLHSYTFLQRGAYAAEAPLVISSGVVSNNLCYMPDGTQTMELSSYVTITNTLTQQIQEFLIVWEDEEHHKTPVKNASTLFADIAAPNAMYLASNN